MDENLSNSSFYEKRDNGGQGALSDVIGPSCSRFCYDFIIVIIVIVTITGFIYYRHYYCDYDSYNCYSI